MERNLVVIATYKFSRAILLRGRLEAEGIECYLANVNLVQSDISSGVKVLIKKEDVANATRIIKEISQEYGENEEPKKTALYKINRILVPIDFSDYSLNACDYAMALASKLKAEIKLVHSFYDPSSVASPFPDAFSYELGMKGAKKDIEQISKIEMKDFKQKLLERAIEKGLGEIKISTALVNGIAGDEILNVSRKYKPGLIVIGTKGKDLKKNDPVGHVTSDLISGSKYPIFAIPREAIFKQFENSKILYVTDFDDPDFSAFRKLMSIVSPYNMKVLCIHVGDEKNNPYDNVQMEGLKRKIEKNYNDFQIECHVIANKDIVKGINEFVKETDIDIIAMTSHKHDFLYRLFNQSIAQKIIYRSSVPLLVFQT